MSQPRLAIGADHRGFAQKAQLAVWLREQGYPVWDLGTFDEQPVDYPDVAQNVGRVVSQGLADLGILLCGTGIGMAMAADKIPGIRAANVTTPQFAQLAREHNAANLLTLSGAYQDLGTNQEIIRQWLAATPQGDRHARRVAKINALDQPAAGATAPSALAQSDPTVAQLIHDELTRERGTIELIASENFPSLAVLEAVGSLLTNKYAEGYPGKRYYGGCSVVDEVEDLARERAKQLFQCDFANVQPHSGASANLAVQLALLAPGDRILGLSLAHGGHLTHGSPANFSGKFYRVYSYGVDPQSEWVDMDAVEKLALECQPQLIITGASAYPRILDYERFAAIAKRVGACLMVDMAHTAGLVAGGVHPSPLPWADVVTSTSHKTLRGPRGGFILTNRADLAAAIDKAVFPGSQGGPLQHVIAGKAVAFGEALQPSFTDYAARILENMQAMARGLEAGGLRLVTGGTDTHLALVDLTAAGISGAAAEQLLEQVGMTVNKNVIPNESRPPLEASGIRVGTAAMTTRGFGAEEAAEIGSLIARAIFNRGQPNELQAIRERSQALLAAHPLYPALG